MKKTVLAFGLISGAISAAMMLITLPFADKIGYSATSCSRRSWCSLVCVDRENVAGERPTLAAAWPSES